MLLTEYTEMRNEEEIIKLTKKIMTLRKWEAKSTNSPVVVTKQDKNGVLTVKKVKKMFNSGLLKISTEKMWG